MAGNSVAWFVIQTKVKQEERADSNLRAWGVETLLPRLRRRGRGVAEVTVRSEPLFPGYLFARFDIGALYAKLRYTRGVSRILATRSGPVAVDEDVIAELRTRIDASGYVETGRRIRPGERVRIVDGPLKDFVGVFEESTNAAERVSLLLSTVHACVRVTVDAESIELV